MPINVNYLAQKAAEASLDDVEFQQLVLTNNRKELDKYYQELDKLGLKYIRSNGNFILINLGIDGSISENEFLKSGIIIRNASEFGLDGWIRVSIGTPEENGKVLVIIAKITKGDKQ